MKTTTTTPAAAKNRISNVPGRKSPQSAPATPTKPTSTPKRERKGAAGGSGAASSRLTDAELELRLQRWEKLKAEAKSLYSEADLLEQELISQMGPSGSIVLSDSRVLRVVNNFIDKNGQPKMKHYGLAGVRMYEIAVK